MRAGSRRGFIRDQHGVSSLIGFILVIALVVMALAAYLREQVPEDWREAEWDTMQEVKSSFLELRKKVQTMGGGDVVTVKVRMGTPSPTAMRSTTTNASLDVISAKSVGDADEAGYRDPVFSDWRYLGTYVREDQPTRNYTADDYDNDHLLVSTAQGNRMWTFLKFDLSEFRFYDSYTDHEFEDDFEIKEAKLLLYVNDLDLQDDPENVMDVRMPTQVEVWGVENDNWGESISWGDQPHDSNRDVKLENSDVYDELEFLAFDVTSFVKDEAERHRGWGKWYQTAWDNEDGRAALGTGRFKSGYEKYSDNAAGVTISENDQELTGTGTLTSMIFDSYNNNSFWENIYWSWGGTAPTVDVRFDNDPTMANAAWSTGISWGDSPSIYARYVQYRVNPNGGRFLNISLEYTAFVSFVVRDPIEWGGGGGGGGSETLTYSSTVSAGTWANIPNLDADGGGAATTNVRNDTFWIEMDDTTTTGTISSVVVKIDAWVDAVISQNEYVLGFSTDGTTTAEATQNIDATTIEGTYQWDITSYIANDTELNALRLMCTSNDPGGVDITLYSVDWYRVEVTKTGGTGGGSTLKNQVAFSSAENIDASLGGFAPVLRITYSRKGRLARTEEGLIDFGYIKYKANNEYFPSQWYTFEGGMVWLERDPGWYQVMLEEPPNFCVVTPTLETTSNGRKIFKITVTRYQIDESSVGGESIGTTGYTSIRVQREEEEFAVETPSTPNRSQVKLSIRSEEPGVWRDYIELLAAKVNYYLSGETDYDTYGDYVMYDYDSVSLTIYGADLDPTVQDIYYTERVIWLDTTLGTFAGGRT